MTPWVVACAVFFVDRLTKILALQFLSETSGVPVWPGVFHLALVRNTGVAFGLFRNASFFWVLLALASAGAIFFHLWKSRSVSMRAWAWAMIAGGALGNAYDRVRFGSVIDFLDFRVWPVFNLADSAIVAGAAVIAASTFFGKPSS